MIALLVLRYLPFFFSAKFELDLFCTLHIFNTFLHSWIVFGIDVGQFAHAGVTEYYTVLFFWIWHFASYVNKIFLLILIQWQCSAWNLLCYHKTVLTVYSSLLQQNLKPFCTYTRQQIVNSLMVQFRYPSSVDWPDGKK